jgi:hypothetical protein
MDIKIHYNWRRVEGKVMAIQDLLGDAYSSNLTCRISKGFSEEAETRETEQFSYTFHLKTPTHTHPHIPIFTKL